MSANSRLRSIFSPRSFVIHMCVTSHSNEDTGMASSAAEKTTSKSNQSILKADLKSYPETFHDKLHDDSKSRGLLGLINQIHILPAAYINSRLLSLLAYSLPWHPDLPEHNSLAPPLHEVYLVSIPHSGWPTSLKHWSLYSQGSFFHLVVASGDDQPSLRINTFSLETLKEKLSTFRFHVHCDSVHRWNAWYGTDHAPMIAYNVGQTKFNASQIADLAAFVIRQIVSYSIEEKNCHLFAISLANRIIMAKGGGAIFVGTRVQIAHWDMVTSHDRSRISSPHNQEEGYLLRAPGHSEFFFISFLCSSNLGNQNLNKLTQKTPTNSETSKRSIPYWLNFSAQLSDLRHVAVANAIRRLYLHGSLSPGSFGSLGHSRSLMRHAISQSQQRLRESAKDLMTSVKEFSRDIAGGELANAFRGRRDSNIRLYEKVLIQAKQGDRITRSLLPFHRFVLSISKQDAREAQIRVKNMKTGERA